ncbi:hypothetical protein BJ742DRAFT_770525 [Cladochytrium replicatum]|nr:hypothetical protein BJ742DRAFT_770525 [Cladochytrium replicatum]
MLITVLPYRLQLITLPVSSLSCISHAVIKNLFFRGKDKFFSYTQNSLEVSIIAEVETAANDFPDNGSALAPNIIKTDDVFRALQVDADSEADFLEESGQRITDISAPLAAAGISIFYLSTYQTDFVFVKERRLLQVISILQKHNCEFNDLESVNVNDAPLSSAALAAEGVPLTDVTTTHQPHPVDTLKKNLLRTETLRLIGLDWSTPDSWSLELLKIMFYPETPGKRRFFSYTATNEGISLIVEESVINQFDPNVVYQDQQSPVQLRCIQVDLTQLGLDRYGIVYSMSKRLVKIGINLLYLSTYMTANVLISTVDLEKILHELNLRNTDDDPEDAIGPTLAAWAADVDLGLKVGVGNKGVLLTSSDLGAS